MEGNIADLIIGLEDATNMFGAEFENMKSFTGWENFVGIFSDESKQRMRTDRVRNMSLAGNLQELLAKSDTIVGILKAQKEVLDERYKTSETSLGAGDRAPQDDHDQPDSRAEAHRGTQPDAARHREQDRRLDQPEGPHAARGRALKLATEYNEKQAKEQELLAESQTLERYTSMFQTFVDSLNNQIAAQSTLINKLTIDTEQRIVLYKALEDSLKTAAQQDVAHKINTLGSQVDNTAEETMAGIGAASQKHIGDLLEMHEKNMVASADIQRRKKLADDAFARRFERCCRSTMRPTTCSSSCRAHRCNRTALQHDPRKRRGGAVFLDDRGRSQRPRSVHARRPLAALPARHRRQDRRRDTSRGSTSPSPAGATGWASWTRSAFRAPKAAFRCSRTCSNWKTTAARRTRGLPTSRWPASCARRWPTSSCATRNSPRRCRSRWPSGSISRTSRASSTFGPFMLAQTAKVSVNPKTVRPYYLVHWATFDGSANLPMVYMVTVEDSSDAMIRQLVGQDGKLNDKVDIPLPVEGLLNPELAHRFDDFTEKNSAYTLSPATIAVNLDKDFETAAPQAAAPRRARPLLFGRHHREQFDGERGAGQGAQAGKCLAADLDHPGGLSPRPSSPAARDCGRATRRRRNSSSTPTTSRPRARACRATRTTR